MNTPSLYSASHIATYFDELGIGEWERLVRTPVAEISLAVHRHHLERFVGPGSRVIEIGAGPGRFTQALAEMGCTVVVVDISRRQLDLNIEMAREHGFDSAIEEWVQADVCDLSSFGDESFDAVVCYGGPVSYVFEHRERAVRECVRVVRAGRPVLLSVMSLWGTLHAFFSDVVATQPDLLAALVRTGDLGPEVNGESGHYCHMFRPEELHDLLERCNTRVAMLSASNALTLGREEELQQIRSDPEQWQRIVELEIQASISPGCVAMGTHIIAAAIKQPNTNNPL